MDTLFSLKIHFKRKHIAQITLVDKRKKQTKKPKCRVLWPSSYILENSGLNAMFSSKSIEIVQRFFASIAFYLPAQYANINTLVLQNV